jgi:hypothetical protein
MSISPQSIKLADSIQFEKNGQLKIFNKDIFKNKTSVQLSIENSSYIIKCFQSPDKDLADYRIVKLKDCTSSKKMSLLIQSSALPSFLNVGGTKKVSKNVWMDAFFQMHKSTGELFSVLKPLKEEVDKTRNLLSNALRQKNDDELKFKATQQAETLLRHLADSIKPLGEEITLSGLDKNQKDLLQDHAAGVYLTEAFLRLKDKLPKNTTIIGLNHKEIIPAMCEVLGFEDYGDAYERMYHTYLAQPDFMEKLTNEKHPILFLVPRNLFGPKQGVTAGEMRWLLDHPKCMNAVTFVFGSYKAYPRKMLDTAGLKEVKEALYKEYVATRIFQQMQANYKLPEIQPDTTIDLDIQILQNKMAKFTITQKK